MASGAAPCSDQRSSPTHRDRPPPPLHPHGRGRKWTSGGGHCEFCVVCGDRACNHHYYGVAACHGCKCFFWRSIKNKLKYICRGDGQCEMNPNHRNACRFCRLQRCLKAGMQPEAVRMPKERVGEGELLAKEEKSGQEAERLKREWAKKGGTGGAADAQCPLCHQQCPQNSTDDPIGKMASFLGKQHQQKKQKLTIASIGSVEDREEMCAMMVRNLVEIETNINEVADFSENEAPKRQLGLESLFLCPELLDRFRTQVNFCVRLRRITEEEMEFCKYRTLAKVVDYIGSLSTLGTKCLLGMGEEDQLAPAGGDWLSVQDKIVLLRHSFAPLALFDIASGTSFATKDTQNLLCLPTGLTICANEEIVPNGFLSQQIVSRCISSLVRVLTELALDQEEFVMVKLIIVLAMDSSTAGDCSSYPPPAFSGKLLSVSGQHFVDRLRDLVHQALYNHSPTRVCPTSTSCSPASSSSAPLPSDAAIRFAKLLHILPKLMLLSRDLVEHIRMVHTFPTAHSRPTDPLFFQLFGDIFHEIQGPLPPPLSSSSGESRPSGVLMGPFGPPQQRGGTIVSGQGQPGAPPSPKLPISSVSPFKDEYGSPLPQQPPQPQQQPDTPPRDHRPLPASLPPPAADHLLHHCGQPNCGKEMAMLDSDEELAD